MNLSARLDALRAQMRLLERFVAIFASSLAQPTLHNFNDSHRGFRYQNPDARHFCLLKAVRAVSAFNAVIELCRLGFTQEISVLLRTVVECTSHIDFALSSSVSGEERDKFVSSFFEDNERDESLKFRKPNLRQGEVHAAVGKDLDSLIGETAFAGKYKGVNTAKLYSKVYQTLSNYVHCRYPETMDLYGGIPGKFHLRGMNGTPKDFENIEILETYVVGISQCLQQVVLKLQLFDLISSEKALVEWMKFKA